MDKKKNENSSSAGQDGWTWGSSRVNCAEELFDALRKEIRIPLVPLALGGSLALAEDDVEPWMNKRGWVAFSCGDAGYFWRVKSASMGGPVAPTAEDAGRLWDDLLALGAAAEAAALTESVRPAGPKGSRKGKDSKPRI